MERATISERMTVKSRESGARLDVFLARALKEKGYPVSRESLKKLLSEGCATVNGKSVREPKWRLWVEDSVVIDIPMSDDSALSPNTGLDIPILFEDDQLLFIDKPAGIGMHPARGGSGETVAHWLIGRFPSVKEVGDNPLRPGMVHRLDRNTSGVVVIAKTQETFLGLKKLFQTRRMEKRYQTIVLGHVPSESGVINFPIKQIPGTLRRLAVMKEDMSDVDQKEARTEYVLRERFADFDFLDIVPKTGRTHQIRVHLASIGCPVLGDFLYGGRRMKQHADVPGRQLLHAASLSFELSGKRYAVESELPSDFKNFLSETKHVSSALGLTRRNT